MAGHRSRFARSQKPFSLKRKSSYLLNENRRLLNGIRRRSNRKPSSRRSCRCTQRHSGERARKPPASAHVRFASQPSSDGTRVHPSLRNRRFGSRKCRSDECPKTTHKMAVFRDFVGASEMGSVGRSGGFRPHSLIKLVSGKTAVHSALQGRPFGISYGVVKAVRKSARKRQILVLRTLSVCRNGRPTATK